MPTYPTSNKLIDRKEQSKQIDKALKQIQSHLPFVGLEYYGIGGLGKSRILDTVKEKCKEQKLAFAIVDLLNYGKQAGNSDDIDILVRICDQLDHYFPVSQARSALLSLSQKVCRRDLRGEEGKDKEKDPVLYNTLIEFRARLVGALGDTPLILILDNAERCSDGLFNWLGNEFVHPLVADGQLSSVGVFLAGRGPKVKESDWHKSLKQTTQSFRLNPLDFKSTKDHLTSLPPEGRYQGAAREIYAISNGHPYSNEVIAHVLNTLGVSIENVKGHKQEMARRLYEEVIRQSVLADADPWILPFVEVASAFHWFTPSLLMQAVNQYRPELAPQQPPQWYQARIHDLRKRPYHLIQPGPVFYELEPTLRKLLHTALVILNPAEMRAIHMMGQEQFEIELLEARKTKATSTASVSTAPIIVTEILYHAAQLAVPNDGDIFAGVRDRLRMLLGEYFDPRPPRDVEDLNLLKDLLTEDVDLLELLGQKRIAELLELVNTFLKPPKADSEHFQFSHLVIEHLPPTEYRVSWYLENQVVLPGETVHSAQKYSLGEWRKRPMEIGKAAFLAYMPRRAQEFVRNHRDWAIQLSVNWADIPWELLYDGEEFLSLSCPVGRRPKMLKEPREHRREGNSPMRALVIGNPTGDLAGAEAEAKEIARRLKKTGVEVTSLIGPSEATAKEFTIKISNEWYDLIHYAGHAHFNSSSSHLSGLRFPDSVVFAEELERNLESSAFVFLSACEVAETKTAKTDVGFRGESIEGIATSALVGGALGCLGPMWAIPDGLAKDFALGFYEHLLGGEPIGEAVRRARLAVRDRSLDFWASWVLYGDPLRILFDNPKNASNNHNRRK